MNIGFIGIGSLGTPLAMNLLESGHSLYIFNRTHAKTKSLQEKGAIVCESPGALAAAVEIVFSIVSDDAALREICNRPDGLFKHLKAGGIHVSMSTILPATAKELESLHRQHGQYYLAAPVFGRPEAAAAKKVNFVVSGEEAIRKKVEPLLKEAGAIGVWDFGDLITAANTVKLCGNFLIAAAIEAIGESTALAKKSGVDAHQMWSLFLQTLFNAPAYHTYSNVVLHEKYHPAAFTMKLGLKDLNLVVEQAKEAGQKMPFASLLQQQMEFIVKNGGEHLDWSALSKGFDS